MFASTGEGRLPHRVNGHPRPSTVAETTLQPSMNLNQPRHPSTTNPAVQGPGDHSHEPAVNIQNTMKVTLCAR